MTKKFSYILMYIAFFIYSLSGVCSKLASSYDMLSWQYILCFGGVIGILGLYAIIWQQVLKNVPLSVAMANKPIVLILNIVWAILFFAEHINITLTIGIILIIAGLIVTGVQE